MVTTHIHSHHHHHPSLYETVTTQETDRTAPALSRQVFHGSLTTLWKEMDCKNIVGLICCCLSFILLLTGVLTDFWFVSFGSGLFHTGLWQNCTKNICNKVTGQGYVDATRTLLILSTALLLFAMIFSCLTFVNNQIGKLTASLVAASMEVASAIFLLIGLCVYTSETSHKVINSSYNYQWSFYLCWTSTVTMIAAAICHLLTHRSSHLPGYDSM